MHEIAPLIKDLAVILGVASLVALLFQRIRQPVVLGYLLAGAIVGPYTPPYALVSDIPNIKIISELGVIFLMFSLGLEFSFHKLKRVGFSASITGLVEVVLMIGVGFTTGWFLGWQFYDSLFLGAALAISSTTIIIKALEELQLKTKRFAELIFGVLIVEDLLAILLLVGISTVVLSQDSTVMPMVWATIKLILVVGGWFLLGYFLIPSLFLKVAKYSNEETLVVVSVALCLFLVCIAAYFDYSTALGAFIMGSILAETQLVHRIEQLIRPLRNIFGAVFFVSIGMLIDFQVIFNNWQVILILSIVTVVGKVLTTGLGAFLTGQNLNTSLRVGFSMAQIGEFSFIIAGLGVALQVTSHMLFPIIIAVSAITTFSTPYCIRLSGYIGASLDARLSIRVKYFLGSYQSWVYRALSSQNKQPLYRKASVRLLLNGLVVGIVFTLTQYLILPKITAIISPLPLAQSLGWLIAVVLSSPFIWGMLSAFEFNLLTEKDSPSRVSMYPVFLSWLLTITEITILSVAYFQTWFIAIFLAGIAFVFFRFLYRYLDKSYHWFESQLIKNLQNNASNASKDLLYYELAPWDTQFVELEVGANASIGGKTLNESQLRQHFDINIVAIYRGVNAILAPRGEQLILPHDKLIVLGHDAKIDEFVQLAQETQESVSGADLLEHFALKGFILEENSSLVHKSIRDSQIREQTNGLVVGLERNGVRTLNPDVTTVLMAGDLLLIVGERECLIKNLG
jgi:monovalent cation:H+ antiporter-2, CPA2 family